MKTPLLLIAAIAGIAITYVLVPLVMGGLLRFRKGAHVVCPETGKPLDVAVTRGSAASWNFSGPGALRVATCPRWPERAGCDQACVARV